jgi:hypothetical protein
MRLRALVRVQRLRAGPSPRDSRRGVRRDRNRLGSRGGIARTIRISKQLQTRIRLASAVDAPAFGRLLHAFNVEFGEPTPEAEVIADRAAPIIESGEITVLFAGEGPDGFAQLRASVLRSMRERSMPTWRSSTSSPSAAAAALGGRCSRRRWSMREGAAPRTSTSASSSPADPGFAGLDASGYAGDRPPPAAPVSYPDHGGADRECEPLAAGERGLCTCAARERAALAGGDVASEGWERERL